MMWADIGLYVLIVGFCLSGLTIASSVMAVYYRHDSYANYVMRLTLLQFICVGFAFLTLIYLYYIDDFSVLNVYQHSHSLQPLLYKLSAAWGNHEGSLLLWVSVLAFFCALLIPFGKNLQLDFKITVIAVQSCIIFAFLAFLLFTSNPFTRIFPVPLEGRSLNPLLQDPGLAFHPPMLYLGYVGLSIVFSFAMGALIIGKIDQIWARWMRPWTLLTWCFLTAGIALGSWWAYYELGWGGYWFWDPVENASFMPWLLTTALLHSAIVSERRNALKSWTILLSLCGFSLSLIGTFIVRSGVLTSVHAFASDPDRGFFILLLLVFTIATSFTLYAFRMSNIRDTGVLFKPISREGALVLNNLFFTIAAGLVLLGTLFPLILDISTGEKITVGPPYFNMVFLPTMGVAFLVLSVAPLLAWKRGNLREAFSYLRIAFLVAVLVLILIVLSLGVTQIYVALSFAFALYLFCAILTDLYKRGGAHSLPFKRRLRRIYKLPLYVWGITSAHLGGVILIVGIAGTGLLSAEKIVVMRVGDVVNFQNYRVTLSQVGEVPGPNYQALRGYLTLESENTDAQKITLTPERRKYVAQEQITTEASIYSTFFSDIHAVISENKDENIKNIKDMSFTIRLYEKAFAVWLWVGAFLMVLGGVLSLLDKNIRIGHENRQAKYMSENT